MSTNEIRVSAPTPMPPPLREQVFEAIREQGFEPSADDEIEERGRLGFLTWEIILWSRDHLAAPVALALGTAVAKVIGRWRKEHKARNRPLTIRVLYAPDGSELARVEVPNDDKD